MLDDGVDFLPVFVKDAVAQAVESGAVFIDAAEDFVFVEFEDGSPEVCIAGSNACGVFKSAGTLRHDILLQDHRETEGNNMGEVAGSGENFIVLHRVDLNNMGTDEFP